MRNKIFLYIISEGLSRGIPQLTLIVLAFLISKDNFGILILLYGLESLIVLLLPSNYVEVLYKIQNKNNKIKISNNMFTINLIIITIVLLFYFLFKTKFSSFYNYDYFIVFVSIIISAFINSFMRFYRTQLQLLLEHNRAIQNMLYSFGFANFFMILFLIIFDDKIFAFFAGKSLGFIIYFIYFIYFEKLKFELSKFTIIYFAFRVKYLFLFAVYSWLFGYGFIYIVKLIGTSEEVANIGYIITFSMPFLLLANGINQVYNPKVKKLLSFDFLSGLIFSKKVFKYYLLLSFIIIFFIYSVGFINFEIISKYNIFILLSAVVFSLSTYKYVYEVYLYVYDLFRVYILGTIFIETLTLVCILLLYYVYNINIIYLYPILIFSRNICIYVLMNKIKRLNIEKY